MLDQYDSYYDTLGLTVDCSALEIKSSYQQLVRKFHPDKALPESTNILQDENVKQFLKIQAAWKILSDEGLRKAYDDQLRRNELESKVLINEEILHCEMECVASGESGAPDQYFYPCRCGGDYVMDSTYLEMGFCGVILTCESCSLSIKVKLKDT